MLLPYLIYNLSDRGDEFSAAEHSNASAYEMRSVQARSRIRLSYASLARDHLLRGIRSLARQQAKELRIREIRICTGTIGIVSVDLVVTRCH